MIRRRARELLRRVPFARAIVRRLREAGVGRVPHGKLGIRVVGHRAYVGGMWDDIGKLQFDFLVAQGLEPHHCLLDVACGSLRAGVHLIPYLEPGNYLGIDKEPDLIRSGVERELGAELAERKRPEFVVSDSFEFARFSKRPSFAIAQSLFTHLPAQLIDLCFEELRGWIADDGVFYATYFESDSPTANPIRPHDHGAFLYTRRQMELFGEAHGWKAEYLGDWNHPREQVIVRYRPA